MKRKKALLPRKKTRQKPYERPLLKKVGIKVPSVGFARPQYVNVVDGGDGGGI